jgi:hypothetical protein
MLFRSIVWNGKEDFWTVVTDWVKAHFGRCKGRLNLSNVFRAAKDTAYQLMLPAIKPSPLWRVPSA